VTQRIPARTFVLICCAFAFLVELRFIVSSDVGYLATSWIKDDSFYYLQPAWMFKQLHFFTFDGQERTYGFQPLWMVLITAGSYLVTDKEAFLRLVLVLGSILHCFAGYLIYRLGSSFLNAWMAALTGLLWLFNADVVYVFVSSKENALAACLLLCSLLLMHRIFTNRGLTKNAIMLGVVMGLLSLARINLLLLPGLFFFTVFLVFGLEARTFRVIALTLAAMTVAVVPWILYATISFGTIFPTSGTIKLTGSLASFVYYLHQKLPVIPMQWLQGMLPASEHAYLANPQFLYLPSFLAVVLLLVRDVPSYAFGFGLRKALMALSPQSRSTIDIFYYTVAGVVGLIGIGLLVRGFRNRKICRHKTTEFLRNNRHLVILAVLALLNALINGMFLPIFFRWGIWYAVPEFLLCIVLAGIAFSAVLNRKWGNGGEAKLAKCVQGASVGLGLLFVVSLWPAKIHAAPDYASEVWSATQWMNEAIPDSVVLGSWSAGLLGYDCQRKTVVNLDGLANSPSFAYNVNPKARLYAAGLSTDNVLWQYIRQRQIRYIADAEFEDRLNKTSFLGVIPTENYKIVYRGHYLLDWREPGGLRRFVVIKLLY
jgi:4-amino-4-deoxy-L-arabinose transferase-like glycosyltransferase